MQIVMISLMAFFNLSFGTEQTPNINEVKSQVIPTQKSVSENELIQKLEEHKTTTLENNQNSTIEQQSTQKSHTKTLEELIGEELLRIVIENTTSILPKTESTLTVEPQTELATVSQSDSEVVSTASDVSVNSVLVQTDESINETENVTSIENTTSLINFDPILDNLNDLSDEQISYLQEKEIIPVEEEPVVEIVEEIIEPAFITDFRQTYYSVEHGEVKVGYGLRYTDDLVKNINNIMHYNDEQYGWIPIVAVNIDEVLATGLNWRGIPNYYGTVLEIKYPEGDTVNAIVLDACGACSWDNRIDLWVYSPQGSHDITGIEYRIVRDGFKEDEDNSGSEIIAADAQTAE